MARGLNGSMNGAGHGPTGREGVEARLPGVSNLSPPVAQALSAVVGLKTTIPFHLRVLQDPIFLEGRADTPYVDQAA